MYYTHRCQIESSTHFEATLHMRQLVLQGSDSRIQRFGCCSIFLFEAVLDSVHSTYVSICGVDKSSWYSETHLRRFALMALDVAASVATNSCHTLSTSCG